MTAKGLPASLEPDLGLGHGLRAADMVAVPGAGLVNFEPKFQAHKP
jgi:hypothetical protein